ncbi:hypothetical protein YM304_25810 [Ilumatobacter coccineus YM16-304]|uniref:Uncharacterized protein n=1 Tax=Ilumatobacter coccineus (strain NBRC 103263 / KCTC 29153 / YM16-304) TaxID=1313172 RepID=A0A6C7ECN9_ILUCY|nr:hypothetical protein YM304_25810 [Ilumatobacter coccineus YM16-304]
MSVHPHHHSNLILNSRVQKLLEARPARASDLAPHQQDHEITNDRGHLDGSQSICPFRYVELT